MRTRWLLFTRLLPFIGPVLIDRDLARAKVLAQQLEIEVLRAQLDKARRGPVLL